MREIKIVMTTAAAAAVLLGLGAAAPSASAAFLSNGDFETADAVSPPYADWNEAGVSDNTADPIGGSHSAQVERETNGHLTQNTHDPSGQLTQWTLEFDLALSDPGGAGDRSFQLNLDQTGSGNINMRAVDLDSDGDGDLQAYDGQWETILTDALSFSSADDNLSVNHLRIVGDYDAATPSFDVFATDAGGTARSALGNTEYQTSAPAVGASLESVNFQSGSQVAGSFYVVDNVTLNTVPEPASLALLAGGGLMLLSRRRRG